MEGGEERTEGPSDTRARRPLHLDREGSLPAEAGRLELLRHTSSPRGT
jgi:hypothetical protein